MISVILQSVKIALALDVCVLLRVINYYKIIAFNGSPIFCKMHCNKNERKDIDQLELHAALF